MSEEKKEFDRELNEISMNDTDPELVEESGEEGAVEEQETIENTVYDWAKSLIAAVVGVALIFTFFTRMISVSGGSMQNTLYTGDRILILNSMYCDYKQGDIVVANAYNAALSETIIKRVIAVGGQTIDIDFSTGTVYVDGAAIDEPYINEPTLTSDGTVFPLTLAEDEVFIMGDNRNRSTDSRSIMLGPVKEDYLQGKAVFLLIPGKTEATDKMDWSRIGFIG